MYFATVPCAKTKHGTSVFAVLRHNIVLCMVWDGIGPFVTSKGWAGAKVGIGILG